METIDKDGLLECLKQSKFAEQFDNQVTFPIKYKLNSLKITSPTSLYTILDKLRFWMCDLPKEIYSYLIFAENNRVKLDFSNFKDYCHETLVGYAKKLKYFTKFREYVKENKSKKHILLMKLYKLKQEEYCLSQNYDMSSDIEEMQYELNIYKSHKQREQIGDMSMYMLDSFAKLVNYTNPNINLDGLTNNIDKNKLGDMLYKMYITPNKKN